MQQHSIIFTATFERAYQKYRGKQEYDLGELATLIQRDINKQVRYLNRPYIKLKITLNNHTLRILAYHFEEAYILIPLFVTDKNDKALGENMTRIDVKKKVELLYDTMITDYETGKYQTF